MNDQANWVRITREFQAGIEDVWRMWTDPEHFASWYGPMGMSVPVAEMDLNVGGTRKICMARGEMKMWFTGVYKEIDAPRRLVYTEAMCQEDGTLIPPSAMGMPEGTPDITEVIVDLVEDGDVTRMTMVHAGVPEGSPGEGGWNQAFDKLAERLQG